MSDPQTIPAAYGPYSHSRVAGPFVFLAGLRIITRATSLGSTESLIEHRHSIEGPDTISPDNLLRLSVGLEHVDDLIEDLDQALSNR